MKVSKKISREQAIQNAYRENMKLPLDKIIKNLISNIESKEDIELEIKGQLDAIYSKESHNIQVLRVTRNE